GRAALRGRRLRQRDVRRERRVERRNDLLHERRGHGAAHPRRRLQGCPPQRALRLAHFAFLRRASPGRPSLMRAVHADAIITGDAGVVRDGAVVVDASGTVVEVGPAADVLPRHAGLPVERARGVLLPGLVNAHTHLELSALRGQVTGGAGFVPWVEHMIGVRAEAFPEDDAEAIEQAVADLPKIMAERVGAWPTLELDYAPSPHTLYTTHPAVVRRLAREARE